MRVVFHGLVKNLRRENLEIDVQDVLVGEMDALDHPHVAIVRHAGGLADGERRLRQDVHRVDDQRVALPMADRMAVEGRIRNRQDGRGRRCRCGAAGCRRTRPASLRGPA